MIAEAGPAAADMDECDLEMLIDQASALVSGFCNRVFAMETVQETFRNGRSGPLILRRRPVVSIDAVKTAGSIVSSADVDLEAESGLLYRATGDWTGPVEVTYTSGYILPGENDSNLPGLVERATILVATAIIAGQARDPLVKSESVEGIGRTDYFAGSSALTLPHPSAESLLQSFVTPTLV
ncbi:hypothetical protein [Microvirga antarctica]|uniref:hypothetical protein n=1 Tax=Microvirga antarctica TaxID=2819233 RepID=UPI001B315F5A|nr:hypothetical protein [Microvirga antarctica]